MLMTRLPDGTILFEVNGRDFLIDYWKAPQDKRTVFQHPPGMPLRPAVVDVDSLTGDRRLTSIPHDLWERARPRLEAMMREEHARHPARKRLCGACGAELEVGVEYETLWTFRCPRCQSVEAHGKQLVGGTIGQGVKEKP